MVTHSSILAWRIPWTEEPGRLQSMGSERIRHDWVTNTHSIVYANLLSFWGIQPPTITQLVNDWALIPTWVTLNCIASRNWKRQGNKISPRASIGDRHLMTPWYDPYKTYWTSDLQNCTGTQWGMDAVSVLPEYGRQSRRANIKNNMIWERPDWPLLAWKMVRGQKPKNVDKLWKLEKARKEIILASGVPNLWEPMLDDLRCT